MEPDEGRLKYLMSLTLEQLEEERRIAALVVRHCGEKYFPLFDRFDQEVQQRRSNSDRIAAALGGAPESSRRTSSRN
ncbi:MAG: hypothetical protein CMF02_16935 [Hyphomonas sp.]|nr:hypothetical protein [Hyphomonas sp.]